MTAQEQAAQDARDRLAEHTALMLISFLQAKAVGTVGDGQLLRAAQAIDDLRYHTGRDNYGKRA